MSGLSYKVGVCLALLVGACSLDVGGTGSAPPAPPAADDAGSAQDGAKATTSAEASDDEASTGADDAAVEAAAPEAGPPPCDLDNDGHKTLSCGGDDCCDNDSRAHPGATDFHDTASACGSFDYDCNGKQETQYGTSSTCDQAIVCADPGFVAATACGVNAPFKTCDWLLGCHPGDTMRTQSCR
jgi:hypothetical protein